MQKPDAPQDQGYGVRGEQIAAQQTMGIPENNPGSGEVVPAPQPGTTGNVTSPDQLLAMMQGMTPPAPGGLARPSERMDEPVTAGLASDDPVTPIQAPNKAADTLDQIFAATGDARFASLAQRARTI
jgi:hypothetical protein